MIESTMKTHRSLLAGALACLLGVAGCGDTPENQLATARQALQANQAQQAIEYANKVLEAQPDNVEAKLIMARSLMRLGDMVRARQTADELIKNDPGSVDAAELLIDWAHLSTSILLRKSEFLTSKPMQQAFDEAIEIGLVKIEWLAQQPGHEAAAWFMRARFAEQKLGSVNKFLSDRSGQALRQVQLQDPNPDKAVQRLERLEARREDLDGQVEQYLQKAFELNPNNYRAAGRLAARYGRRGAWEDLWFLSRKLTEQNDLTASLSALLVRAMIQMPDSLHVQDERVETGWQLQKAVRKSQQRTNDYLTSSARLHLYQGNPAEAKELLEQVLGTPRGRTDKTALFMMANCQYALKQYEPAKKILNKLVTEQRMGDRDAVLTLQGMTLLQLKEYQLARQALAEAKRINPNNRQAQEMYLRALSETNMIEIVEDEVAKFWERDPTNPRAIRQYIQYLLQVSKPNDMHRLLEQSVEKIDPLTKEHLDILAKGYLALRQYGKSEQFASRLVEQTDALADHLMLAETMLRQHKDKQVRKMLASLRQKFPNTPDVDHILGKLYLRARQNDRAIDIFQRIVEADPANHNARLSLAQALAGQTLTREAIEQIDQVLKERPDDIEAHILAARIYRVTGRKEKLDEHLEHLEKKSLDERRYPAMLALIKITRGKHHQAMEICNRALSRGSTDPLVRTILAEAYLRGGQIEQAEAQILAQIRGEPNNPAGYIYLVRFYHNQGMVARGLVEMRKLRTSNNINARLAESRLLRISGQHEQALHVVEVMYDPLIKEGHRAALLVADSMAQAHHQRGDLAAAIGVYQKLIDASMLTAPAMLRQVDLHARSNHLDKAIEKLDELSETIGATQRALHTHLVRRYILLGRSERGMQLVDKWIAVVGTPEAHLLKLRADLLITTKQPGKAVAVLHEAIKLQPDSVALRSRLAMAHLSNFDYPGAALAFDEMGAIDPGARLKALAGKGQMFLEIGLTHQADAVFAQLESIGRARDPRVLHAMGQAYADRRKDEMAMDRLGRIPQYARQYPSAQLLMARIEQRNGRVGAAKKRLEDLAANPRTTAIAVVELLKLKVDSASDKDILRWCDEVLSIGQLPSAQQRLWLQLRNRLYAASARWADVLESLDRLAELSPDAVTIAAARVLVMHKLHQNIGARQLYRDTPRLVQAPFGPGLAVVLDEPYESPADRPDLAAYLEAVSLGRTNDAANIIERLPPMATMFRADMKTMLDRNDADSKEMRTAARLMLAAAIAREIRLPHLANDFLQIASKSMPDIVPLQAMRVSALQDMNEPVEAIINKMHHVGPSQLKSLLEASDLEHSGDYQGAATALRRIAESEPTNIHIRYRMATDLQSAGRFDEAIAVLEQIIKSTGPWQIPAKNDLAYLLAEHTDQLERAYHLARQAYEAAPQSPELRDTLGWIEYRRDDPQTAYHHLSRAIAVLTQIEAIRSPVHYHMGAVYKALGNARWAKYHLEQARSDGANQPSASKAQDLLGKLFK